MKKLILILIALIPFASIAQNNVQILPTNTNLCYGNTLSVSTAGNSFTPLSYVWSTGATTPTINITQGGTYTVTITGYGPGNNFSVRVYTRSKTYTMLPRPTITPITNPWVCRFDTVKLAATNGYASYTWNNGTTGLEYARAMDSIYGTPTLDTMSVWYTATSGTCVSNSDTIVVRGVRAPNGVGQFYCGKTNLNINDSVPAGLVLAYRYPNLYQMEFTEVGNPSNVITNLTWSRYTQLSLLEAGKSYTVRSRVIIDGIPYCWGDTCLIGIKPASTAKATIGFDFPPSEYPTVAIKNYRIISMDGKVAFETKSELFNEEWLRDYPSGVYIVQVVYKNNISVFKFKNK